MKLKNLLIPMVICVSLLGTSCVALVAGAAAGGSAAYIMTEKGYKVQSPVTK